MPETGKPKRSGERFRMMEPKEPNFAPPGSENWPVREIVFHERFMMLEPREPNLSSNPKVTEQRLFLDAVARLPEPEQSVFAEVILSAATLSLTAAKLGLARGVVTDLLLAALDAVEQELRPSQHEAVPGILRLLAHYRDGLDARAPSVAFGG